MFLHSEKFDWDARQRIEGISALLKIRPDWLTAVIAKETGGTFSPSIKNKKSSATGLIQFMESTARQLGTSTAALARMSQFQQLKYVYDYLKPFTGKMNDANDVYFAVFYPPAIGRPDSYILPLNAKEYAANRGIDLNKNGRITRGEFIQWFQGKRQTKKQTKKINPITKVLIIGAGIYLVYKIFKL